MLRGHELSTFAQVYDTALTEQEMDRIGNYLSTKFNLKSVRHLLS